MQLAQTNDRWIEARALTHFATNVENHKPK